MGCMIMFHFFKGLFTSVFHFFKGLFSCVLHFFKGLCVAKIIKIL